MLVCWDRGRTTFWFVSIGSHVSTFSSIALFKIHPLPRGKKVFRFLHVLNEMQTLQPPFFLTKK